MPYYNWSLQCHYSNCVFCIINMTPHYIEPCISHAATALSPGWTVHVRGKKILDRDFRHKDEHARRDSLFCDCGRWGATDVEVISALHKRTMHHNDGWDLKGSLAYRLVFIHPYRYASWRPHLLTSSFTSYRDSIDVMRKLLVRNQKKDLSPSKIHPESCATLVSTFALKLFSNT